MKSLFILIKAYKKHLSPVSLNSCRHDPTFSDYVNRALSNFGVIRGRQKSELVYLYKKVFLWTGKQH